MKRKALVDIHPAVKRANERRVELEARYYRFASRILAVKIFGFKIICSVIFAGLVGLAIW